MTTIVAGSFALLAGQSWSVGPAACCGSRLSVPGCPCSVPHGTALTAARPPAADDSSQVQGRTAAMCLAALPICALLAALSLPAGAQALDLERGSYVASELSCDTAPSLASVDFDGRAFVTGRSACRLEMAGRQGDTYNVSCMEGTNTASRETQRWTFKLVSRRSFSINGTTFKLCPAP